MFHISFDFGRILILFPAISCIRDLQVLVCDCSCATLSLISCPFSPTKKHLLMALYNFSFPYNTNNL